jgi:hypothetical protein
MTSLMRAAARVAALRQWRNPELAEALEDLALAVEAERKKARERVQRMRDARRARGLTAAGTERKNGR